MRLSTSSSSSSSSSMLRQNMNERLAEHLTKTRTVDIFGRKVKTTWTEIAGHCSFILVGVSYNFDDMLTLRLLAVSGSLLMLTFTYFHPHGRVLWLPFCWNAAFIVTNVRQLVIMNNEYLRAKMLPDDVLELRTKFLPTMKDVDFYKLYSLSETESWKPNETVFLQGDAVSAVRLIISGSGTVHGLEGQQLTYQLKPGNFIAEGGLHAGLFTKNPIHCSGTVSSGPEGMTTLVFKRSELIDLLNKHDELSIAFQSVLSWDVVNKLKSQRQLIARGVIPNEKESVAKWHKARHEQSKDRYAGILASLLSEGEVGDGGRQTVQNYRRIHAIEEKQHIKALEKCGWTKREYDQGWKRGKA